MTTEPPGSSPATDRRHGYAARMDRRAGCPFGGDEPCGGCHGDCWSEAEQEREPEPADPFRAAVARAFDVPAIMLERDSQHGGIGPQLCCRGGPMDVTCAQSAGCW